MKRTQLQIMILGNKEQGKIQKIKDKKSPQVDWKSLKIVKEIAEEINVSLAILIRR